MQCATRNDRMATLGDVINRHVTDPLHAEVNSSSLSVDVCEVAIASNLLEILQSSVI